jgi:uncharacterized RDD family membrane protein YckC
VQPSAEPTGPYGGLVTRGLAFAIDVGLLYLGLALVTGLTGLVLSVFELISEPNVLVLLASGVGWAILVAIYFSVFWVLAGQTPGMRWMRIAVEPVDGGRMRPGRCIRRLIGMLLAAIPFGLGYALILIDDRRRGLHDRIAGTVVRRRERAEPFVSGWPPQLRRESGGV